MKILLIILVAILVILGIILAVASTRPNSFRIQRTATIQAPPGAIYPFLADFHRWAEWSPWEKMDPAMTRTFGGPDSGVGATYAWKGNKNVGEGGMEITDVTEPTRVVIKLDFLKPFEAHNTAEFTLTPQGDGTTVTWVMAGPSPLMAKVMGLFMSMDAMVGKDFEAGLANLKQAAERRPAPAR
ncbi:SRPBCC family protein [Nitrospirillum sp. BR 11163]|uniref:SRPBCC family protein n=1 Tax=Nitrospirillum sp. BR 11163 TaxID=3104323 RepID=UPI002AFDF0E4|nr:SRPBCC family protein [Nitrospirillum sp. BR 11163]MEA1676385.1 SRPBCC family protein [Nitrospirillum sp. BR 11163]